MVRTQILNPAEWIPSIGELLADNWAETGFDFDFNPDVAAYRRMYEAGMLFAVAAFDDEKLIGYCTVTVIPHPHNPSVIVAANDALFVTPEYRNGVAAGRLILVAQNEAKRRGAVKFSWHCRYGTPLAEMLISHGYSPVDVVVMKGL
jgi:GNAT superfamily N-acetyltransferase